MQKVLIDCDPGHDDAIAILYAASRLDLVGISTVYGNQTVEKTTRNALSLCTLFGLDLPVAQGADRPLVASFGHGGDIHGATGIDGADLPEPEGTVADLHAADFIIETARRAPGDLMLVLTGPFTNAAMALRKEPRLAGWLKGITMMGGTTQVGNTTAVAEFNIVSDPEAADVVMRSGCPLWLAGLNVTRQVGVGAADIDRLRGGGTVARTLGDVLAFYRERLRIVHGLSTASLHDPCALLPLTEPDLMSYRDVPVHIELTGTHTRGMTVCDFRHQNAARLETIEKVGRATCSVAVDVDGAKAVAHFMDAIMEWDDR